MIVHINHIAPSKKQPAGDGSLVTWVNGALLRAVGARAGYDVHFAPFPSRPGTRTTILYTTQRA